MRNNQPVTDQEYELREGPNILSRTNLKVQESSFMVFTVFADIFGSI